MNDGAYLFACAVDTGMHGDDLASGGVEMSFNCFAIKGDDGDLLWCWAAGTTGGGEEHASHPHR